MTEKVTENYVSKVDTRKSMQNAALPKVKIKRKHVVLTILSPIVMFFVWWFAVPYVAPPEFGVCKTFIEMHVKYPHTLRVKSFDVFDGSLRIYYTYIEPFGNVRSNMVECVFRPDQQNGYILERMMINRKAVLTPEEMQAYNATIPAILASDQDLTAPPTFDLETRLIDLKTD